MRPRSLVAALAGATLLLAGCSGGADEGAETAGARIVQPGAPGEPSREVSAEELAALDLEVAHTDADAAFMQGMIPHHAQALRMTRLVPSRTGREDVPLFAERMDLSQEDEIDLMRRWLEDRGEEVPSLLAEHEHDDPDGELMPGMLTEDELAELEAASGEEFDRLFLESMIRHHLGAIAMVEELYAEGGGAEPEIARFADHVVSDQQIEIARAQQMLAEIDGEG
jgi:uncharacterized protein (DUF305 family)